MTAGPGFVCLYFGNPGECRNCGGWVKAGGGPFPGDPRYCSGDCFADAQERSRAVAVLVACCPGCGYDRAEHRPGCHLVPAGYCPGGAPDPACACGASWAAASLGAEGIPAHRRLP